MEEATFLTKFASSVTLVHRRDTFRASQIMQERVKKNEKIKLLLNSQIKEVIGEFKLEKVKIENVVTHEITEMPIGGIFVAIGHTPNTTVFKGVEVTEKGFVKAQENTHTNIPGIFVSGDVEDDRYMQGITAAGFGCQAALDIERYLRSMEE
jgi:thioredoxin reductase (NADPH)